MKKGIIIEAIWLAVSLIGSTLLSVFASGSQVLDINLHNTYIIEGGFGPALSLSPGFTYFIILCFFIYIVRVLYFGFKIISVNIIFLIITGLALYFLSDIMFILYPPVFDRLPTISKQVNGLFNGDPSFHTINWLPRIIKISLMLILTFTGFIIGKNWNLKSGQM